MVRPLDAPRGPWTTYGPAPATEASGSYGPRENCVFVDNGTNMPSPRLSVLTGPSALVTLSAEQLGDGPWCPDGDAPGRWDADLLRVRSVGVLVRVQSALASLRGPAGDLFLHGGSARAARRWAPDLAIRFYVSPRNMIHGS
jgi:hypothetical protein